MNTSKQILASVPTDSIESALSAISLRQDLLYQEMAEIKKLLISIHSEQKSNYQFYLGWLQENSKK